MKEVSQDVLNAATATAATTEGEGESKSEVVNEVITDTTEKQIERTGERVIELKIKQSLETKADSDGNALTSLCNIDRTVYANTRKGTGSEEEMAGLCGAIKSNGLLHPIVVCKSDDKFALIAGFRRFEAVTRNALEKLIRKYNSEKKLKPVDDGFIDIKSENSRNQIYLDEGKIPDTEQTWKDAFISVFKEATIKITIDKVDGKLDAKFKNIIENWSREDFTPLELCYGICELIEDGVKQKDIATRFKKTPSHISQYVKIIKMLKKLDERVKQAFKAKEIKKDEAEILIGCVNDLKRRGNLPKGSDGFVSFSHLRALSSEVIVSGKTKELKIDALANALKLVTKCNSEGQINLKSNPPDYGDFCNSLKAYRSVSDSEEKDQGDKKGNKEDEGNKTATKEAELKETQADNKLKESGNDELLDASELLSELNDEEDTADQENAEISDATDDELSELDEVYGEMDDVDLSEIEDDVDEDDGDPDETKDTGDSDADEDADEDDDDELSDVEKKALEAAKEKEKHGQGKVSTADKPSEDMYSVKSGPQIEKLARKYLENSQSKESTIIARACDLAISTELLSTAGLKDEATKLAKCYYEYIKGAENYIKAVQGKLQALMNDGKVTKEELKEIVAIRPNIVKILNK